MKKLLIGLLLALALNSCTDNKSEIDYQAPVSNGRQVYSNQGVTANVIEVDSVQYIVVRIYQDGVAIIRHDPKK